MKKRKSIQGQRTIYTTAYLRNISWTCLERAKEETKGRYNFIASSMVFTAFSVEAYLNHLGSEKTNFWDTIERKLSPKQKLDTLSSIIGIDIDYGSRPFQTFQKMFSLRNSLAHGRTEKLPVDSIQVLSDDEIPNMPTTTWEEEITIKNASRYLADSKEMIRMLNEKAGMADFILYVPEETEWFTSLVDDDT
jgi:hypothetical protein